ncbi:hypothetical protein ES706_01618 [subsurface metagenome]
MAQANSLSMKRSIILSLLLLGLLAFGCASPPETVTPPPAKEIIEDLAYVKISPTTYTDDADPEADGFGIDIRFYDSKSQPIHFSDVPIQVTIEVYGYKDTDRYVDFDHTEMEFICTKQTTIDHSIRWSEMYGNYIKIPFESLPLDPSKYYKYGTVKVTVITPQQGSFEAIKDYAKLYPKS